LDVPDDINLAVIPKLKRDKRDLKGRREEKE
jgi:hypothetical protein